MKISEKVAEFEKSPQSISLKELFKVVIGKELHEVAEHHPVNWDAQSVADLMWLHGLSETQAYKLKCAFELSARLNGKPEQMDTLGSLEAATTYFQNIRKSAKEMFMMAALDAKNHVIGEKLIGLGSSTSCVADIKDVIRTALALGANSIIVAHNHPSGDATPSREDVKFTQGLKEACKMLDIALHDHLILGRHGETYSFARDRGL